MKPFLLMTIFAALSAAAPALAAGTSGTTSGTSTNTTGNRSVGTTGTGATTTWNTQNEYWRSNYSTRPYYNRSMDYTMYEPAYRYGTELYSQNSGRPYTELETERLRTGWDNARGTSSLSWNEAQLATQDAYNRMYEMNRSNTTSVNQ